MNTLNEQVGGDHYKSRGIQPIVFAQSNQIPPCEYSVIKHIYRHADKLGDQDVKKAIHYARILLKETYGIDSEIIYHDHEDDEDDLVQEVADDLHQPAAETVASVGNEFVQRMPINASSPLPGMYQLPAHQTEDMAMAAIHPQDWQVVPLTKSDDANNKEAPLKTYAFGVRWSVPKSNGMYLWVAVHVVGDQPQKAVAQAARWTVDNLREGGVVPEQYKAWQEAA